MAEAVAAWPTLAAVTLAALAAVLAAVHYHSIESLAAINAKVSGDGLLENRPTPWTGYYRWHGLSALRSYRERWIVPAMLGRLNCRDQ